MENSKGVQHIVELKNNVEKYYKKAQSVAESFGGPSIYFHEKALECIDKEFLSEKHLEYIYATLASWGMHRMGSKGAKMPEYKVFKESILSKEEKLRKWKNLRIETISQKDFDELLNNLTDVCFSIKASTSKSQIVSGSKTLAHILPNLVCPIDRQYTLNFFNLKPNSNNEQRIFQYVMKSMYEFFQCKDNMKKIKCSSKPFFRSYPKIYDNLIIAFGKDK